MAQSLRASLDKIQNGDVSLSGADTPMLMMLEPDIEPEITVDMDSRTITIPDALRNIGVVNDNNAETVYIRIPSISFDGVPLTDKKVYVEYINAGNEYGTYEITDTEVEGNSIKLGWTIDNNITRYAGLVNFQLTFELDTNYKWSTVPNSINILAGLKIDKTIASHETAVVSALFGRVGNLENLVRSISDRIETDRGNISELQVKVDDIESELELLKDGVVYTLSDDI